MDEMVHIANINVPIAHTTEGFHAKYFLLWSEGSLFKMAGE